MNYARLLMVGLIALLFLGLSCSSGKTPAPVPAAPAPTTEERASPGMTGWEAEWEKTLKAAQKEGKVVVYAATPGPALKEASAGFKKKFGITMEVLTGPPGDIRNKIVAERANGLNIQDLFITGMNSHSVVSLVQNWPDPIEPEFILPEVKDPKYWLDGKHPFQDDQKTVLGFLRYPTMNIAVNTKMVKEGEITSYFDLLKPQWTGKVIINDPRVTGTAFNAFSTFVWNKVLDLDYFRQIVKQGPVIRDATTQIDWLAKEKYPVVLWPDTNEVRRYQEAGAPIEWLYPREGVYLSMDGAGAIMLKQRPHPNASRIFLNWLLSREGQIEIQQFMGYHSARVDTAGPGSGLAPINTRQEGVKYHPDANGDMNWLKNEQNKYQAWANEIFGETR